MTNQPHPLDFCKWSDDDHHRPETVVWAHGRSLLCHWCGIALEDPNKLIRTWRTFGYVKGNVRFTKVNRRPTTATIHQIFGGREWSLAIITHIKEVENG